SPSCLYMSSNMPPARSSISLESAATGSALWRKAGCGYLTICMRITWVHQIEQSSYYTAHELAKAARFPRGRVGTACGLGPCVFAEPRPPDAPAGGGPACDPGPGDARQR